MKRFLFLQLATMVLLTPVAFTQGANERVHVLQKRDYSVKNKVEISLFGGLSVDDIFTKHYSGTLALDYHINEAFALEGLWMTCKIPFYNGTAVEGSDPQAYRDDWVRFGHSYTDAYHEVVDAHLVPSNADLAMISNFIGLSVLFSPIYGKWSFFNLGLGHADLYVSAGGGVASTEYQKTDGSWVDTGNYFVGTFGMGFRIFLARWFALRVDLKDFTFAARVRNDLNEYETKIRNTLFLMFGVSFLFGGEAPVEIWSPY